MRRRDLIAGLLLTSAIGHAQAQRASKVYRLAIVTPSEPVTDLTEIGSRRYSAFLQRLREHGYVEGQNLDVARYSGEGRTENFADLVVEAIKGKPDVMYVVGDRLMHDVKAATDTIPVVTIVGDPIPQGIVTNLARPGGNITGITVVAGVEMNGKVLELLREIAPSAVRIAVLTSRRNWEGPYGEAVREAARKIDITIVGPPLDAPFDEAEYLRVFAGMTQAGAEAVYVFGQPENIVNARLIVELAEKARLPAIYAYPDFAAIGGLMSYGVDLPDVMRHAADQVDRILQGSKPGDIPFYQPIKFTLAINVKAAKALGITVPPTLLIAADEVIE